jgi:hypothetical protein
MKIRPVRHGVLHSYWQTDNDEDKNCIFTILRKRLAPRKWMYFCIQCYWISERVLLYELSQASSVCVPVKSSKQTWMSIECWGNNIDMGQKKYSEKTPVQGPLCPPHYLTWTDLGPYRTVNNLHLGYKNKSVIGVWGKCRCLFGDRYKTH